MVFVYLGDVAEIKREAEEVKDVVNARYREILGDERYARLDEMSSRLLVPECYFSSRDELRKRLHQEIPERSCNKFLLALDGDLSVGDDGKLEQGKMRTSPAFYIDPEAFKFSGGSKISDRQIVSYIHEFNHFVQYALQHPPLYLAQQALLQQSRAKGKSIDLEEFMNQVMTENSSDSMDITKRIITYGFAHILRDLFESSNSIMDKMVLDSIGVKMDLPWRGTPRKYYPIPTPIGNIGLPGGGDPFVGFNDREVIDRTLKWQDHLGFKVPLPYFVNLFDSLKTMKVSRMALPEFLEFLRREG